MRFIFIFVFVFGALFAKAQGNKPFEGEIELETYENYSDYIKKMPNSIYFDGVHKLRLIVKGDKMHLIDETTKCHTIVNAAIANPILEGKMDKKSMGQTSNGYIHFCDYTKTGMDFSKNSAMMCALGQIDLTYPDGSKAELIKNTFAETSTVQTILDKKCKLYEGDIDHKMGGMDQKYHVKAYVSDLIAPNGFKFAFYGLNTHGIPMKCAMKYDGGHVSVMSIGELSIYVEMDVTKIISREVSDDEFAVPANYKISPNSTNAFALMKYYKSVKKELVKLGIKGGAKSEKSTGVHYKTDGEWDF